MSAVIADALARPAGWSRQVLVEHGALRTLAVLGRWLDGEVIAGRVRDIPRELLIQQLVGPVVVHCMMRQGSASDASEVTLPALDECCDMFADAFLRAVAP